MARFLLRLFFLSLYAAALTAAEENPMIRQVIVGDGAVDNENEQMLSAEAHFSSFLRSYGKKYSGDEEHAYRFKVFKSNLRMARRHQKLDPTAVHGVTKFSDLTPAEFRRQYLGIRKTRRSLAKTIHDAPVLPTKDLPTDFDWRDHGAVTGVKDQCDASEPDACDSGCNGGLMTTAFEYLAKSGGLETEKDYPYTGTDRVAINAVFMQFYVGGVSCPYICSSNQDHGVLLVGYGSEGYAPIRLKNKPYWIIKNSWGQNWGDQGYYKICRGRNICGVESQVSTVTVATSVHPDQVLPP
ncbi:Cysteine proteinase 1 [Platanthera guangdongensis]|uniref:Cysteine proteinase 1 n=1 Tax=Platanthera guangdongensis TaxID=2320717 RepID=A0ABR2M204_9ASPA